MTVQFGRIDQEKRCDAAKTPRTGEMLENLEVGEVVVYPHHGAATIEDVNIRVVDGEKKRYLTLKVSDGDLTIQVPEENLKIIGVRDVVDEEGVQEVRDTLRQVDVVEHSNWSRRFKENQGKITSGKILDVAEVVRDLYRREQDKGLSTGEKRMLGKARQILTSEIALAREEDEEASTEFLNSVLDAGIEAVAAKEDKAKGKKS